MKIYRYREERIIEDLKKIVLKYRKEAENLPEERLTVSFQGNEYSSYEEIQDAYGAGMMSMKTFDYLAKKLKEKKEHGTTRAIRENLENSEDWVKEAICELTKRLKYKKEHNEKELNREEREKNAARLYIAYMELKEKEEKEEE